MVKSIINLIEYLTTPSGDQEVRLGRTDLVSMSFSSVASLEPVTQFTNTPTQTLTPCDQGSTLSDPFLIVLIIQSLSRRQRFID